MKNAQIKNLALIIIMMITLVVLILIIWPLLKGAETATEKTACKQSVLAYSKTGQGAINCPTSYVTVTSKSETEIKEAVAQEMFSCWDSFYRGKLNLVKSADVKYCSICSVIEFKEKGIKADRFLSHLLLRKIPRPIGGQQPSYYTYITGVPVQADTVSRLRNTVIDTDNDYAVVFLTREYGWWGRWKLWAENSFLGISKDDSGFAISDLYNFSRGPAGGDWISSIVVLPFNNETLTFMGCEELITRVA